ncbi:MAG TPA: peptide ABC transporter permease [Thiomicrospira sp.]|nr:peptide ABC transporter permease [Thiomicrospira sp.]
MSISLLWTDMMIWGVMLMLAIWGVQVTKSAQAKQKWQLFFQSKVAMISAIILVYYLIIALLDSFQLKSAQGGMQTGLDFILNHLVQATERTYSAPFATNEFNKSLEISSDGVSSQVYLPLQHVIPETSILLQTFYALINTVIIASLLFLSHLIYLKTNYQTSLKNICRKILKSQTKLPWLTAYITVFLLILFSAWIYQLSHFYHVMGTDKVGEDVIYTAIKSIRTGVLIGVLSTIVALPIALVLGISAGLFKGWIDDVIQYIYTTLNSIPGVLLIASAVLVMHTIMNNHPDWFASTEERADLRLLFLVLILGLTSWTGLCRLLRAETLKISQIDYVTAANAFGVSKLKIIIKHITPNLTHIILITIALDFSGFVLAEAVLSYVGVGVDPTMNSWGNMINQARLEMAREPIVWWSLISAFFFMFVLLLSANLLSDRVQKVLDPRNNN